MSQGKNFNLKVPIDWVIISEYQKASSTYPRITSAIADLFGKEFVPISTLILFNSIVVQLMVW